MQENFFAASIDQNIFSIDLHATASVPAALEQLEHELFLCFKKEKNYCQVIHGIGEGILAEAVHEALTKNPMVVGWKCDGGRCLVVF